MGLRSRYDDTVQLAEAVEAMPGLGPGQRALALPLWADAVRTTASPMRAFPRYEEALSGFRDAGDRSGEGWTLVGLGALLAQVERSDEARASYTAALTIAEEVSDPRLEAVVLGNRASLDLASWRIAEAEAGYTRALALQRATGRQGRGEASILTNLAQLRRAQGLRDEAREVQRAALDLHRELGNRWGECAARSQCSRKAVSSCT